jgi:hypothetical protein
MFVRSVIYQRKGVTLIKSFYCGDPQVIAYPNCTVWIQAPEATFELAVLLVKPLRPTVIPCIHCMLTQMTTYK